MLEFDMRYRMATAHIGILALGALAFALSGVAATLFGPSRSLTLCSTASVTVVPNDPEAPCYSQIHKEAYVEGR
jgi:hypothetical protein